MLNLYLRPFAPQPAHKEKGVNFAPLPTQKEKEVEFAQHPPKVF